MLCLSGIRGEFCAKLCLVGGLGAFAPRQAPNSAESEDAVRQLERRGGLCRLRYWLLWKCVRPDVVPRRGFAVPTVLVGVVDEPSTAVNDSPRQVVRHAERCPSLFGQQGKHSFFPWPRPWGEGGPPFWGGAVYRYPLCKNLEKVRMLDHGASCLKMLPQHFQTFTMTGLEQEVSALRLPPRTGSWSLLRDSNFP